MAADRKADTIVIGGGMAGLPMALRAPATVTHAAKVAHLVSRAADFGVETGSIRVDLTAMVARKTRRWRRNGLERTADRAESVRLVRGYARFIDGHTIEAEEPRRLSGDRREGSSRTGFEVRTSWFSRSTPATGLSRPVGNTHLDKRVGRRHLSRSGSTQWFRKEAICRLHNPQSECAATAAGWR